MGKSTGWWVRSLTPLLTIVVMLTAVLPQAGLVRAADFSIPCVRGIGDTSALIAALTTANSNGQADVIQLGGTPEQPCTYTLYAVDNTIGGPNGLPIIGGDAGNPPNIESNGGLNGLSTISSDAGNPLTIEGNGATIRRDPEAPPFRLLFIDGGNLTMRGLTLMGGLAIGESGAGAVAGSVGGFGGAIFNAGSLTLDRVTVTASEARGGDGASRDASQSGGGGGGGAGLGGAIFNSAAASLSLVNTTLSGNTARGGNGGAGGANGFNFAGGGGGGAGGSGGIGPDPDTGIGQAGAAAVGLGGGGGGGSGSNGGAGDSFAPGNPAAGAGGAGDFGGGGGGAGASRFGGAGGPGGPGGDFGGAGGPSCCSYAAGGGGGAGLGGAIFNDGGALIVSFSTLYGNDIFGGTGGPGSFGFGNGASGEVGGAAFFSRGGAVSYGSSIIAGNGWSDCATSGEAGFASLGSNVLAVEGGCDGGESDQFVNDPGLLPLADNGGAVLTHALAEGSPALDAGDPTCPATDARGFARPAGEACDSGAFESGAGAPSAELVVTTSADSGPGSLRAAIDAANLRPGADTINFDIDGGTIITPTTPLPALTGPTLLDGLTQPGATTAAPVVTIDGSLLEGVADGLVLSGGASVVRGLVLTGFGGAGISVPAGVGNTLRENRFSGDGIAIDLGADGPTANDAGDGDTGANNLQNFPTIVATEGPSSVTISGALDAAPGSYTLDLFASASCQLVDGGAEAATRLSGPGQGEHLVGTLVAEAGAPFSLTVDGLGLVGQWISASATDADGNTSELSPCAPVRTNDLWPNALALDLAATGQAEVGQSISRPYQERWYKFPVGPGGRVHVELNAPPGSILTLHRDIQKIYDQLSLPQSAEAVAANEQTSGFLPGAYLPGAYLPGAYLPGAYLPGAYLPGAYLPGAYLPGAYLPGAYLPGAYLPGAYLPGAYLPGAYLPGAYLPEQYSAAAVYSLMAFAADPGSDKLTIERNTWDLAENLYVRVVAPTGSSFTLDLSYAPGICAPVTAPAASLPAFNPAAPAAAGTFQTLMLWDSSSVPAADRASLGAGLLTFAQRPEVNGLLVDLAAQASGGPRFPRVAAARATLAANPSCVAAANLLATEIKAVVDGHRLTNQSGGKTTLKYVVLTGGDDAIPLFRYPDVAGLANENEYFPPVEDISQSNAALREGRVTGQDAYGSTVFIRRGTHDMPVPDLAVGRLVGNAATVLGMLNAYTSAGGQVSPSSALVTGYDFVADGAEAVYSDLRTALTPPGGATVSPNRLIQPEGLGSNDPSAWSAADLRAQLFNPTRRNDLVFFTGHFAAGSALAADYKTSLLASEVATSGANFTNTILFGLGCHSGYNIPAADAIPGFSPQPDWPLAWNQARATYIAATGFAYGDTELIEYGERLLVNLSKAMHTGNNPVAIGQALVRAKQDYLAQKASLSGIDEKTVAQFTLYGLPMLRVNLPGKLAPAGAGQLVDGVSPVAPGTPGATFGLKVGTSGGSDLLTVASTPVERTLTLTDTDGITRVDAVYYEGTGGEVVVNPTEPIFPLERREVGVSDPVAGPQILRGVGFRGGVFQDRPGQVALTSAPATENARGFLKFLSDTLYPSQPWSANYFDALRGGSARLFVVPAQYQAGTAGGSSFRVFSSMDFKLFYLDADWPGSAQRAAGLAPAPEITQVQSARLAGGNVAFAAFVLNGASGVGGAGVGVQEVWVTYSTPGSGHWQSVDLAVDPADPTRWIGPAGGVSLPDGTVFMVQAAGGAGKVSLDTNSGAYYTVAPTNPVVPPSMVRDTILTGVVMPASGPYGSRVTFSLRLTDDQATPAPLSGRSLRLFLGGQVVLATTNAAGQASFSVDLAQPPGAYTLQVSYLGEPEYRATRLSQGFTITPAATSLSLAPTGRVKAFSSTTGMTATLRIAGTGAPIADETVIFVASGKAGRFGAAVKTNLSGQAILGAVPWPKGKYTVTAYYSGNGVPVTGGPASLTIPYLPSQSASLTLQLKQPPRRNFCYADEAQSWRDFSQGKRRDGRSVASDRSNPRRGLGLPQSDDTLNYVALGFGGKLTLVFKNPIVNDGTRSPDIRVWETSPGDATRPWSSFPEAVQVYASADGNRWTLIGRTTDKDQAYDLVLPEARYIRLVDVSDRAKFGATEDGFDLDGIEVLNGCRPYDDEDEDEDNHGHGHGRD